MLKTLQPPLLIVNFRHSRAGSRAISELTCNLITCKPDMFFSLLLYASKISPSLSLWYGFHGNWPCEKRKTVSRLSELFFFIQFLSLSLSSASSLALSFTDSQRVCGAINIINQHNSTALSSAGRDEEARGNANMLAWSSLNQWYISHITWMGAEPREERQTETDRLLENRGTIWRQRQKGARKEKRAMEVKW